MKNLLGIFVVIAAICFNCDGRQTKREAFVKAVAEYNLNTTPLPAVIFSPDRNVEIVTDTLIANSLNVRIRNYSLMDAQIVVSRTEMNNSSQIQYQRIFESEITITKASKSILSTHISAKQFKGWSTDPFWKDATLQHTWVNQELSSADAITLEISFINPNTKGYKLYRMYIDTHGKQALHLIEEHS
ncbi:hypothetical protein BXY82_2259 [Gelidibacter sediminis]|uniref:Uncharacterized protein n=1 Tax=Gelidibacter sediminis TaxID=1608710 RepID=A0A4R7PYW4_9FLAO|nr:hypothetical protein [Gelidibacter sediminis]TDU40213.1 hypothetical protein BXY82_2259 [Gelidibacter sediminis]